MDHRLSNRFLRLAVIFALIGMIWGNIMGATHDHSTSSAHAHLNLLGWVSMSIYGLFYRVVPQAGHGRLAWAHFWVAVIGVILMVPSLPLVLIQYQPALALAGPVLALAGLTILLGMALFAIIVFRATGARSAPA